MLIYQRVSDMENHPCFIRVSSDGFTSSIFWVFSILPGMMVSNGLSILDISRLRRQGFISWKSPTLPMSHHFPQKSTREFETNPTFRGTSGAAQVKFSPTSWSWPF